MKFDYKVKCSATQTLIKQFRTHYNNGPSHNLYASSSDAIDYSLARVQPN